MYIQDGSECFKCRDGHFCVAGKKQEVFFNLGPALIVSPPQYLRLSVINNPLCMCVGGD